MGYGESFQLKGKILAHAIFEIVKKTTSTKKSEREWESGKVEREKENKNKFPIKIFYRFSLHIWHRRGNRFRISLQQ